ncbi:GAF domain-containing protein [Microbacterium caowuchunii]|uniref:GAF domain-containing protein n=1 Tax=Microbacterium caowuchunii TaxID=2614638 RepID=UPI0012440D47|nr:GAF domain-containing protein [Microbacterium caowuchunii]QEW00118.1 GAF domain-containing protein [Microbacterium caowuchunii]
MPHPVYRAPMRSRRDDVPPGAAVERALTAGLCGFGGALGTVPATAAEAARLAAVRYDERLARRIERFAAVPDAAYVWTRDEDGLFWLGRLTGGWRYDASPPAEAVDLVHVRPCHWTAAPVDPAALPAAVRATFARGGRNWQEIHDPEVSALSAALWDGQKDGAA